MRRMLRPRADRPAATDLLLVCSSGGHLLQLTSLAPAWDGLTRVWVSFDKSDVASLLAEPHVSLWTSDDGYDARHFCDLLHMGPEGRARYSPALLEELARLMSESPR